MSFATFLLTHGYELAFRRDGFVEVLATRGHERFSGRGVNDDDAMSDLMRCMFPSAAARALLDAELAATTEPLPLVAEPAPPSDVPDGEPTESLAVTPSSQPADAQVAAESDAAEPAAAPASVAATPVALPATSKGPSDEDVRDAVEACEDILAEIEERLDELSRIAPESQRLLMLSCICRARAEVEEVQRVEVHQATARVAKRLSESREALVARLRARTSARRDTVHRVAAWTRLQPAAHLG